MKYKKKGWRFPFEGLYPELHGITDDYMYDEKTKSFFMRGVSLSLQNSNVTWHQKGKPIWTSAKEEAKRIWLWRWPGCNIPSAFQHPLRCDSYQPINSSNVEKEFVSAIMQVKNFKENQFSKVKKNALGIALFLKTRVTWRNAMKTRHVTKRNEETSRDETQEKNVTWRKVRESASTWKFYN